MQNSPDTPEYDYIAYIDESGDDGLKSVKPRSFPGSSEWLVLSAVVIRAANESKVAGWVQNIRSGFRSNQARALHFADLSHSNKIAVCKKMASLDVRCFAVASNKKNMQGYSNPDACKIPSQCWFYCWMTRVLLERVSRFVLDRAMMEYGEPRLLRIEYSARGGLKYNQMNAYYEWLRMKRANPYLPWGKICFEVIHQNLLRVYSSRRCPRSNGLSVAPRIRSILIRQSAYKARGSKRSTLKLCGASYLLANHTTLQAGLFLSA
jgi:hypothetical protein